MFHPSLDLEAVRRRREAFLREGHLVVPALLDDAGVAALSAEVDALIAGHHPDRGYTLVRDERGVPVAMKRMDRVSDVLFDLARDPALLELASSLLGKSALPLHTEYRAMPAHDGAAVPPHQDHVLYDEHFGDELAVSLRVALDEVTEDDGATEYALEAPLHLLPHCPSFAAAVDHELASADGLAFRPVAVRRGGCIAAHSFAIHRTSSGLSDRPRRVVVFVYRGSPYRQWLEANG